MHTPLSKRPYQLEAWCLKFPKILDIIPNVWQQQSKVSLMYSISRKLDLVREQCKKWCLDHKKFQGLDWKLICTQLASLGNNVSSQSTTHNYIQSIDQQHLPSMIMGFQFLKQRMKNVWYLLGDTPALLMYAKVKQRLSSKKVFV